MVKFEKELFANIQNLSSIVLYRNLTDLHLCNTIMGIPLKITVSQTDYDAHGGRGLSQYSVVTSVSLAHCNNIFGCGVSYNYYSCGRSTYRYYSECVDLVLTHMCQIEYSLI